MGRALGFTKREWFTLGTIGSVHFASAICISIQAPFYPLEAELKGATASEYGLVFGIFELISFISSPIFGKYMDRLGAKIILNTGIVVAALSSMAFGMLDLVNSHTGFISLSFVIRIIESLGASAAVTASFSITALVFPDSVATTFATLEVFYGLGYIVGPTIGGYLYQIGGFICPFLVMGGVLLLDGVFIFFALPNVDDGRNKDRPQAQIFSILRVKSVMLDAFSVSAASISVGYYSATLEPHLRQFELSPVAMGGMFVINGGVYAITAPLVGRLCDSRVSPKKMIIFGSLLVVVSFLLVGPAPYTGLPTTLWMCCLGLVVHGLGYACILVPAFIDAIRSTVAHGFPDDITTYGIVSGIWASSFALGAFIGPSVAGILFDVVGFRQGTLFVVAILTILFIAMTSFVCCAAEPALTTRRSNSASSIADSECVNLVASWTQDTDALALTTPPSSRQSRLANGMTNGYGSVSQQHSTDVEMHR